jgi:hypothetical protein
MATFGQLPTGLYGMQEFDDQKSGSFSARGGQSGALGGTGERTVAVNMCGGRFVNPSNLSERIVMRFLDWRCGVPVIPIDFAGTRFR